MTLYQFYADTYYPEASTGRSHFAHEIKNKLELFEDYIISHHFFNTEDLIVELKGEAFKIKCLSRCEAVIKFYRRLLRFHQHYVTEENYKKEPFLSVRTYFKLQTYHCLENESGNKITVLAVCPPASDQGHQFKIINN